jgi:hypothetical protein
MFQPIKWPFSGHSPHIIQVVIFVYTIIIVKFVILKHVKRLFEQGICKNNVHSI